MKKTRREFIKDAAVVGAVIAASSTVSDEEAVSDTTDEETENAKCPFFDQQMMCGGPDEFGKYTCDA